MTAARKRRFDPEANRAAILAAAEACFLARGFAGTSMSEIAKASSVTKSLIHHHFGSKEALWKEVKRRRFAGYHDQQMQLLSTPPTPAMLKKSMETYFLFLLDNPETFRMNAWMQLEGDRDATESVVEMRDEGIARIKAGQEAGLLRADVEAPFMLVTFLGVVQAWFMDPVTRQQGEGGREAALAYLDSAWKIFATGVSAT